MSFTEDWFSGPSCDRLAALVAQIADVEGLIVEVGSWEGRSTVALANAAHPRTIHAVDTWRGSPGEISADLAVERDVFATWHANVAELTKGNVEPHRMGWREFAPTVDEPVALLFIDAEHTYREVYDNVLAFLHKMAPGGVICGDDQHHPPIRRALLDLFDPKDVSICASVWSWTVPA